MIGGMGDDHGTRIVELLRSVTNDSSFAVGGTCTERDKPPIVKVSSSQQVDNKHSWLYLYQVHGCDHIREGLLSNASKRFIINCITHSILQAAITIEEQTTSHEQCVAVSLVGPRHRQAALAPVTAISRAAQVPL